LKVERAHLERLDQDSIWLNEHYYDLRRYRGKVIAIKEKQIIAVQDSLEALLEELEKKNENPAFLLIEAMPSENIAFIL